MINDKLIDVFLQQAEKENLIKVIKQILNHFKLENEYQYEERVNTFVNIVGGDKPLSIEDIDMNLLKENIGNHVYKAEEIDKDSIKILDIDLIDRLIQVSFTRNNDGYARRELIKCDDYLKIVKEN